MKKRTPVQLISRIYQNPVYQGKHIIIGGHIYATRTGSAKTELLERLLKKYPKDTPVITYIPAEDSLIGDSTLRIPVGFLDRDDLPPLLGRQECLDIFELTFTNFFTSFRK